MSDPLHIIHAPKNPAGLATSLAVGERALGHRVTTVEMLRSFRGAEADHSLELDRDRGARYVANCVSAATAHESSDILNLWFGATYVHFPRFGAALLDLPLLARKAKVIATYVGSDIRLASEHSPQVSAVQIRRLRGRQSRRALQWHEFMQRRSARKMQRYAAHVFAMNPDLLRYLAPGAATFLPYAVADLAQRREPIRETGPLRILHAPTDRAIKGTDVVLEAVRAVNSARAGSIELVVLDRVPRSTFLAELAMSDLYVDQLLLGWYGVSAVEAMLVGTPVACFIDDQDLVHIPAEMAAEIPLLRCEPSSLEQTLTRLVSDRSQLAATIEPARAFALRWHAPQVVAQQTVARYREALR